MAGSNILRHSARELISIFHSQNDGASVECRALSPGSVINSILVGLKEVEGNDKGRDRGGC